MLALFTAARNPTPGHAPQTSASIRRHAYYFGAANRVEQAVVAVGDLYNAVATLGPPWSTMRFDYIVSNPPCKCGALHRGARATERANRSPSARARAAS